jgi:hypothetical protein
MVGEYYVLRSIIDHTIPKLIGWSDSLDYSIQEAMNRGANNNNNNNPHNYRQGGGGQGGFGGVPF